jgi:hypothetical protein
MQVLLLMLGKHYLVVEELLYGIAQILQEYGAM